jgi:zinc transport system substrate-binding protein
VGIAGLSPDDEPSPAKLAEVANTARANNVHYIFFEQLVSPKLSQTIAQEVGAQTIAFNPLEGLTNDEVKTGKDYISVQKDNLQALRVALDCK